MHLLATKATGLVSFSALMTVLVPQALLAQMTGAPDGGHGMMCGGMMCGLGMVLGLLFVAAAIAALVTLAVFLVRRSRPPRGPREA